MYSVNSKGDERKTKNAKKSDPRWYRRICEMTSNFVSTAKSKRRIRTVKQRDTSRWLAIISNKNGRKWERKGITIRTGGQVAQGGHDKKRV